MNSNEIILGIVIEVNGDISKIGMYNVSNDTNILFNGDLISGLKVGAFVIVKQGLNRIVTKVISEKIKDNQNSLQSEEFDNRFSKNSINRIVEIKTQGIIDKNGNFKISSALVPMIGNEVSLATRKDINSIFSSQVENHKSISIGKSLLSDYAIKIPINQFFASHIGIFGNTGSGKSNTLHKLFLELFRSKYRSDIIRKSQFFVIDFNGEYMNSETFVDNKNHTIKVTKNCYEVNTRGKSKGTKLPITQSYLFDADILAIF